MKLTEHFALEEMTVSPTAKRLGLSNTPTPEHIENMRYCCEKILEPVRAKFGPVTINSSYRAPLVNKAVGGSKTSQHVNGQAIDFEVKGVDNKTVADWIGDNLEFDQVILEFYTKGDKNSGWVHASIKKAGGNRKVRMIATKSKLVVRITSCCASAIFMRLLPPESKQAQGCISDAIFSES